MEGARDDCPIYLTSLVDRDAELAFIAERMERGERLLTVFGPPGVGKTRLAVEALRAARSAGIEGYFCDLFEARSVEDVAAQLLRCVLDGDAPGGSPDEAVTTALSGRPPSLVVLDNFEHLAAVAAATVARWAAVAPDVSFLVTSRELLRVPGETALELSPLRVPSSVDELDAAPAARLLRDSLARYRAASASSPGEADGHMVCEVLQRLEGLPLAIEIVAPNLALLGVRLVHERLERILSRPARMLRDTIGWSWALLDEAERTTLACCAVFHGGFTVEALEWVVAGVGPRALPGIVGQLAALRDKSLVHPVPSSGAPRFGTYATITEFAREQLDELGLRGAAEGAHRAYFAALARQVRGDCDAEALEIRRRERGNLTAAIERTIASGDRGARDDALALVSTLTVPIFTGDQPGRLVALIDRVFDAFGEGDDRWSAYALLAKGTLLVYQTESFAAARAVLERAIELARAHGERSLEARALTCLATLSVEDSGPCVEMLTRALEPARAAGDATAESEALARLVVLHVNDGAFEEALPLADDALRLACEPVGVMRARIVRGVARLCADRVEEADADARIALEIAERYGLDARAALVFRATTWHLEGELTAAATAYQAAIERCERLGRTKSAANSRVLLALLLLEQDLVDAALEAAERAEPLLDDAFDPMRPPALAAAIAALARGRSRAIEVNPAVFDAPAATPEAADVMKELAVVAQLDLARRRHGERPGSGEALAEAARARFESLVREGRATGKRSIERALVERMLARTFARWHDPVADVSDVLIVQKDGDWFRAPGGPLVMCRQRPVIKALLRRLAEARRDEPGRAVPIDELRACGWPDEAMARESARNRLKQSIAVLRRLGLDALLCRSPGAGYFLSTAVPIRIAPR